MNITIKTTHIEMTPDIQAYVDKRFAALDKFVDPDETAAIADIELARTTEHHQKGNVYRAEINVQIKGTMYRAEATAETLFAAVDQVKNEITRELRRDKNKHRDLIKRGGARLKTFLRRGS